VITKHGAAAIDRHGASPDPAGDCYCGRRRAPYIRGEAIDRVIGKRDCLVNVVVRQHDADRAEQLVLRDLRAVVNAG
jgi:hypothetical protein